MKNLRGIGVETEVPLFFSNSFYLKNKGCFKIFFSTPVYVKNIQQNTSPGFNRVFSKQALIKQDYDVFHPTGCLSYFEDYLKGKPFVMTVHHLNTLSPDNLFVLGEKGLAVKANHIVVPSNATKEDLLYYTSINENKITVIYHGNSFLPSLLSPSFKKNKQQPYFLYVGGRHSSKNFQVLLRALKVIREKYDIMLLCPDSLFSSSEMKMISAMNLSSKVKGFIVKDDSKMRHLYSNAVCFIYPSLKEGFGFPILESFACKCPVLLSNASCFPEIAGDAGLYFDPYDLDSVIDSMLTILSSDSLRHELINKGLEQNKQFSWRKTAEKHLAVYESVL
jgi:glycosyltransferase involved in cell wall biosynthesis